MNVHQNNVAAGVFMAAHHDRNYCGKCCVTYMFKKRDEEEQQ